jgi:DNA uptake protein ComE-like DNA-binding protein
MHLSQGQRLGILTVLIVSLALYGASLLNSGPQVRELPLPWGVQGTATVAVEVRDERGSAGIYFFPEGTALPEILKAAGIEEELGKKGAAVPAGADGFTITVSADKDGLKIGDLPPVRRLALGLKIDLNHAREEDLALVPGVGERLSAQIAELRRERGRFEDLSDLAAIPGIREKKLAELEKYLTVKTTP